MRKMVFRAALTAATVVHASVAGAQTESFHDLAQKIITDSKVLPLVRSQDVRGQSTPEPTVMLLATSDGTIAKARLGYLLTDTIGADVTFSGPVSGGASRFATARGLGSGVTAQGALRLVLRKWEGRPTRTVEVTDAGAARSMARLSPRAQSMVDRQALPANYSLDDLVSNALSIASDMERSPAPARPADSLRNLLEPRPQGSGSGAPMALPSGDVLANLRSNDGRESFARAFRLLANDLELWQVKRSVIFSLGASTARPTFTVVDGTQFKSVENRATAAEFSLGVVGSATRDRLTKGYYAGLNFSTGKSFSATARNTCVPVNDSGATQCRNAVLSAPSPTDTELYEGDFRYFFSDLKFAVGFRPSYDRKAAAQERWALEFPVFFLQNSKDLESALSDDKAGFTGGVSFGVKDSPDGASFFAVFSVGSVFKLPGLPH